LLSQGVSPKDIPEITEKVAEVLLTAHQISPEWHVRIQAAFQEYVDNAVSKTVNLPSDATEQDVDKTFRLTYEFGCKGTTVYRDASRVDEEQIITASDKMNQVHSNMLSPRPRAHKTKGQTTKFRMGCGTLFATVNKDENGLCEVFANLGKAGGCPSQSEGMCRSISVALRCRVDPKVLIEQLKGIRCLSTITRRKTNKDIDVLSCPDAIARAIEDALEENSDTAEIFVVNKCPDCGQPLRTEAGCSFCDNDDCGYLKCG
jgi:ribonucleoside-diphosphate reductase alpha chain